MAKPRKNDPSKGKDNLQEEDKQKEKDKEKLKEEKEQKEKEHLKDDSKQESDESSEEEDESKDEKDKNKKSKNKNKNKGENKGDDQGKNQGKPHNREDVKEDEKPKIEENDKKEDEPKKEDSLLDLIQKVISYSNIMAESHLPGIGQASNVSFEGKYGDAIKIVKQLVKSVDFKIKNTDKETYAAREFGKSENFKSFEEFVSTTLDCLDDLIDEYNVVLEDPPSNVGTNRRVVPSHIAGLDGIDNATVPSEQLTVIEDSLVKNRPQRVGPPAKFWTVNAFVRAYARYILENVENTFSNSNIEYIARLRNYLIRCGHEIENRTKLGRNPNAFETYGNVTPGWDLGSYISHWCLIDLRLSALLTFLLPLIVKTSESPLVMAQMLGTSMTRVGWQTDLISLSIPESLAKDWNLFILSFLEPGSTRFIIKWDSVEKLNSQTKGFLALVVKMMCMYDTTSNFNNITYTSVCAVEANIRDFLLSVPGSTFYKLNQVQVIQPRELGLNQIATRSNNLMPSFESLRTNLQGRGWVNNGRRIWQNSLTEFYPLIEPPGMFVTDNNSYNEWTNAGGICDNEFLDAVKTILNAPFMHLGSFPSEITNRAFEFFVRLNEYLNSCGWTSFRRRVNSPVSPEHEVRTVEIDIRSFFHILTGVKSMKLWERRTNILDQIKAESACMFDLQTTCAKYNLGTSMLNRYVLQAAIPRSRLIKMCLGSGSFSFALKSLDSEHRLNQFTDQLLNQQFNSSAFRTRVNLGNALINNPLFLGRSLSIIKRMYDPAVSLAEYIDNADHNILSSNTVDLVGNIFNEYSQAEMTQLVRDRSLTKVLEETSKDDTKAVGFPIPAKMSIVYSDRIKNVSYEISLDSSSRGRDITQMAILKEVEVNILEYRGDVLYPDDISDGTRVMWDTFVPYRQNQLIDTVQNIVNVSDRFSVIIVEKGFNFIDPFSC